MRFFRSRFVTFLLPCRATFICDSLTARQARLHERDLSRRPKMNMSGRRPEQADQSRSSTRSRVNPELTGAALARPGFSLLSRDHSRVAWRDRVPGTAADVSVSITSRTDFALTAADFLGV